VKWADEFVGTKGDLVQFMKSLVGQIQNNTLSIQAQGVSIPADRDLVYKVKYSEDEEEGEVSIKITWSKADEE